MSQTDTKLVIISNGEDFFEVPASDVAAALNDGFYLPRERGMTVVSNGTDVFEIPVSDVAHALRDGFRDLIPDSAVSLPTAAEPVIAQSPSSRVAPESEDAAEPELATLSPKAAASLESDHTIAEVPGEETSAIDATDESDSWEAEAGSVSEDSVDAETADSDLEMAIAPEEITLEEPIDPDALRRQELQEALLSAEGMQKLKVFLALHAPTKREVNSFMRSYGVSTLLHIVLLVMLGFLVFKTPKPSEIHVISSVLSDADLEADEEGPPVEVDVNEEAAEPTDDTSLMQEMLAVSQLAKVDLSPESLKLDITGAGEPAAADATGGGMTQSGAATQGALGARSVAIGQFGGTPSSEAAVEAALDWLTRHQAPDGSWCFNHSLTSGCNCPGAGSHQGRTGATGAALLTFFGAGYTYADGPRAETIRKGLQYLLQSIVVNPAGYGDLKGENPGHGGIYQHGLAAAALCEALAINRVLIKMISKDRSIKFIDPSGHEVTLADLTKLGNILRNACQLAINYIVFHQDSKQGGWGYQPKSAGDTSILGWQVMALISARSEKLLTPSATWAGISNFLNTVSSGAGYAYRPGAAPKDSTTAIGILCRMYTGAQRSDPRLKSGVEYLSKEGPKRSEMYYNYYATQAVFAWGDEKGDNGQKLWTEWNNRTRDMLVATQGKDGHAKGSWVSEAQGGRHFATCLGAMTLEIYYRKLPVYQRLSLEPIELK